MKNKKPQPTAAMLSPCGCKEYNGEIKHIMRVYRAAMRFCAIRNDLHNGKGTTVNWIKMDKANDTLDKACATARKAKGK